MTFEKRFSDIIDRFEKSERIQSTAPDRLFEYQSQWRDAKGNIWSVGKVRDGFAKLYCEKLNRDMRMANKVPADWIQIKQGYRQ